VAKEEVVLEALAVVRSRQELSLDNPVGDDAEVCVGDLMAARTQGRTRRPPGLTPADRRPAEPDRMVIVLRLVHDLIQDAIAARIGYSQMYVSRRLRCTLGCLRPTPRPLNGPDSSRTNGSGDQQVPSAGHPSPISPGRGDLNP
jgi:DNA-directed RNA polymerase specialized sigma subunit